MKIIDQKGGKGLEKMKVYKNSLIYNQKWYFIPYFSV